MSIPIKHHYLPEFFQRRWAGADGKVTEYRRPHAGVILRRVHPSQTGFQRELYAVPSRTDPRRRQALEIDFMSPLDNQASKALTFIETHGRRPDDQRLASAWSRFLLSLMHRSPERVAIIRRKLREEDAGASERLERRYAELRRPDDPPTAAAYRAEADEALYEELEAALIRRMIDSPFIGAHLNNMQWSIGTFHAPKHGLVLSDNPIIMSNGIGTAEGFVLLPVSPGSFFMAVNARRVSDAFAAQQERLERGLNDAIVRQAELLVIAADDRHKRFVDKRLMRGRRERVPGLMERQTWKAPV